MSRFFDIRPPQQRNKPKKHSHSLSQSSSRKSKSNNKQSGLLIIIFIICVFIFIFSITNSSSSQYSQAQTDSAINNLITDNPSTSKPTAYSFITPSKIEEENNINNEQDSTIDSSNNENSNNITVVVMNGARASGVATKAKDTLENNNITVSEIGNTENLYSQTTIYYTEKNTNLARKISETLADYDPVLEINDQFASDQKITVIIGQTQ